MRIFYRATLERWFIFSTLHVGNGPRICKSEGRMKSKTSYHYHPLELLHDIDEMIPGNPIDTIHGCNSDSQEYPGELAEHNAVIAAMIERGEIE